MPEARPPARRRRRALSLLVLVLLVLAVYLARNRIAARLLEPGVAGALRDRFDLYATWTSLEADIPPDLSRVTLRLRGLALRKRSPSTPIAEADLGVAEADFGFGAALHGELVPRTMRLGDGRIVLDLRDASVRSHWPDVLPVLGSGNLAARVLLPGDRTLVADGLEIGIDPPPVAQGLQAVTVQAAAVRLAEGETVHELGRLAASLGWSAGVITVIDRAQLSPPDGGEVALLVGARLDLADAAGPRVRGHLEAHDVHLDALELSGLSTRTDLTLAATVDAPLGADGVHDWLAAAQATLDAQLVRPGTSDRLDLRGTLAHGVLTVERGAVTTSGGRADLLASRVTLGREWADTRLELDARAELDDLQPLGALVAPLLDALPRGDAAGTWSGSLHGRVRVSGLVTEPAFDVDLAGSAVRVAGWLAGDVTLRATGDRRLARVAALQLHAPGGTVEASGTLDMHTLDIADARANLALRIAADSGSQDLLTRICQLVLPGSAGELEIDLQAAGPLSAPAVTLQACAPELTVGGAVLRDGWLAAARGADALHVSAARADVDGTAVSANGDLRGWPGLSEAWSARVDALRLERGGVALDLQEPCSVGWDGRPHLAPLDVAGAGGTAHAELIDLPSDGPPVHALDVRVRDVRPPAFLLPAGVSTDALDVDLHLAWNDAAGGPRPADLREWLLGARDGTLRMEWRATGAAFPAGARAENVVLRVDLDGDPSAPRGWALLGADGVRAALPATLADALVALRSGGEVQTETAPGQVVLVGGSGRLPGGVPPPPSVSSGFGPCTLGARATLGDELRLVEFGARDETSWRLVADGVVGAPLDLRAALAGGPALAPGAAVLGTAILHAGDLAALRDWLGDVRRLTGALLVEGHVTGTIGAPVLVGRVQLADGALRLGGGLPALEALAADVELDVREARIVHFSGEAGSAPFELSGRARLDGGPDALDLHFGGRDLLIWRGEGLKARADVDVALTGSAARPAATGRITLRDTRLTRNINALQLSRARAEGPVRLVPEGFGEPPLAALRFDLALDAAEPVRIDNNIVRGACVPSLHVGGTGAVPLVVGTIDVQPTRVALPGSVVRVTGGTLSFSADDPGRPQVDLTGEARVRHWEVSLRAEGPFDEPSLTLASRPPMASEDVLLLLLTGQPPAGTRDPSQVAAGPVAVYLGQDLLARWLTESPDAGSGALDRLEFGYAEDVTTRGSTEVQVSYRLSGEPGAGRALYLQAEKDPYDAVNFGLRWRVRLP